MTLHQQQYVIRCKGLRCRGRKLQAWVYTPGDRDQPVANLVKEFQLLERHNGLVMHRLSFELKLVPIPSPETPRMSAEGSTYPTSS